MEVKLVLEDLYSVVGRSEMVSKDSGETRVCGFPFSLPVATNGWNLKMKVWDVTSPP